VRFSHAWEGVKKVAYSVHQFSLSGQSFVLETRENVAAVPSAVSALRSFVLLMILNICTIYRRSLGLGHIAFVESLLHSDLNKNQSLIYVCISHTRLSCFI